MTMLVGSSAGARDLGIARIRKTPIAGTFYIGTESEVLWAASCYLTINDNFMPWTKSMRYEADTIPRYIDYDVAYSDQHTNLSPVPVMGPPRVIQLTGASVNVSFDASASYCPGSTIASHSFTAPGSASVSGGGTATPTVNYTSIGHYVVYDLVTATNGKTTLGSRYVFVWHSVTELITSFQITTYHSSWTQGGWDIALTAQDQMALGSVEPNAYMVLFAVDIFDSVIDTCPGEIAGAENVMGCGWIDTENITFDPDVSSVTFAIGSLQYWMKKLPNFSIGVQNCTGTAAAWTEFQNLTVDLALYHFLYWQSTIMNIADVYLSGDTKVVEARSAQPSNFWNQLQSTVVGSLYVYPGVDKYGRLSFVPEPQIVPIASRAAAIPTLMTMALGDFHDEVVYANTPATPTAKVSLSGVAYSGGGVFTPYISNAPGFVMGHFGDISPEDNHLVASQAQANEFAGLIYAWKNNPYPQFTLHMMGNYRVLDMWPSRQLALTVPSNLRGAGFTGALIIRDISGTIDENTGYMQYDVTFEVLTIAANIPVGITYPVPVIPTPVVPTPPIIPPINPIPMPMVFAISYSWILKHVVTGGNLGLGLIAGRLPLKIKAACVGETSFSFNIEIRTDPNVPGTDILASEMTVAYGQGTAIAFVVAALPIDCWLWLDISAVVGLVQQVGVTIGVSI